MPSIFGSKNPESTSVKYFEIRLDESNIVLRGTEQEAPSAIIKGILVLCLSEPLQIKGIRMRLTGERRLAWYQTCPGGANYVKYEEEFLRHNWQFKKSSETLPAGNYEWPFDMIVEGSTPESLEGLHDSWIIYRMKATIERGVLQQNYVARKQVRIIRSLDPTALELAHSMSVENIWPNKLGYCLSTPVKAVVFGSFISVDFKLIPLLKGLRIGKIFTELVEKQDFVLRAPKVIPRAHQNTRSIHKDTYSIPSDVEAEDIDGQEGFLLTRQIPVPQTLRKCVQTVDCLGIKVRHSLNFNIQLHNPDGHVSELHANLPVYIYLSPNLPIDDHNNLVDQGSRSAIAANSILDLTPPQYGEHHLDLLYSDIDPSGYLTPIGAETGPTTPLDPRSRSVSSENLASMSALASSSPGVNSLQARLSTLNVAVGRSPRIGLEGRSPLPSIGDGTEIQEALDVPRSPGDIRAQQSSPPQDEDYFAQRQGSSPGQTPQSPTERTSSQVSEEAIEPSRSQSPQHVEYSAEDLAKVPSYSTALRSNPRIPINAGLPSYQTAVRSPMPSPSIPVYVNGSRSG